MMAKVDNYSTELWRGRSLALLFGGWEECSHYFNKMEEPCTRKKGMSEWVVAPRPR